MLWGDLVRFYDDLVRALMDNRVSNFVTRRLFKQVFGFANVQLFNAILLRRDCCALSHVEFVRAGLIRLKEFSQSPVCSKILGDAWTELKNITQAVDFLSKYRDNSSLSEVASELCSSLSVAQLNRLAHMFWDDTGGGAQMNVAVRASLERLAQGESASATPRAFLMDDDASVPFALDTAANYMPDISYKHLPIVPSLRGYESFHFLEQE